MNSWGWGGTAAGHVRRRAKRSSWVDEVTVDAGSSVRVGSGVFRSLRGLPAYRRLSRRRSTRRFGKLEVRQSGPPGRVSPPMQTQRARATDAVERLPRLWDQPAAAEASEHRACEANTAASRASGEERRSACVAHHHRHRVATVRLRPEGRVHHDPCRCRRRKPGRGPTPADRRRSRADSSAGNPLRRLAATVACAVLAQAERHHVLARTAGAEALASPRCSSRSLRGRRAGRRGRACPGAPSFLGSLSSRALRFNWRAGHQTCLGSRHFRASSHRDGRVDLRARVAVGIRDRGRRRDTGRRASPRIGGQGGGGRRPTANTTARRGLHQSAAP
jgi:hypothetical protein